MPPSDVPPSAACLHRAASACLRRPSPTILPPTSESFSITFRLPYNPTETPVLSIPHHIPSLSLSYTLALHLTPTLISSSLTVTSPASAPFISDGIVRFSLLSANQNLPPPSCHTRTLSFHLTPSRPSTPRSRLTPPRPPSLVFLTKSSSPSPSPSPSSPPPSPPPIWRDFRSPSHAVVSPDGSITVRADVLLHTQSFSQHAAAVEAAASCRAARDVSWLPVVAAVLQEPALASRCVARRSGDAATASLVELAVAAGKAEYARLLLANGAVVGGRRGAAAALHAAVEAADVGLVELMVATYGADVEATDGKGETCLFRVAGLPRRLQRPMVECLVGRLGAAVDCINAEGVLVSDLLGKDLLEVCT